jgi:hypothetical protein
LPIHVHRLNRQSANPAIPAMSSMVVARELRSRREQPAANRVWPQLPLSAR